MMTHILQIIGLILLAILSFFLYHIGKSIHRNGLWVVTHSKPGREPLQWKNCGTCLSSPVRGMIDGDTCPECYGMGGHWVTREQPDVDSR